MAITVAFAEERLQMWLDAEAAVATGQSYKIGSRQLVRADLPDIRKQIAYWDDQVTRLKAGRGKGARVVRIIPRDL
jgi:hypothetical protein